MKVWELIEELRSMDPDLTVYAQRDNRVDAPLRRIGKAIRTAAPDSYRTPVAVIRVGSER